MVVKGFKRSFFQLVDDGLLDLQNPCHVLILHYVFLPRINRALELFTVSWNNHGLRTEHGMTPRQLWVAGGMGYGISGAPLVNVTDDSYGVEELDLPASTLDDVESLEVEDVMPQFPAELQQLTQIDPMDSRYTAAELFVQAKILLRC